MNYTQGTKTNERELQIMEGRNRMTQLEKLAPNRLQDKFNGRAAYIDGMGWAKIVGGFLNDPNHIFIFNAFHVRFSDGSSTTVEAIKILKIARSKI